MVDRSPAEPLLRLEGVHTHIGQYHILQGVEFDVPEGGITMLLGRNGAGKTTALRTIMGLWQPSRGGITFDGRAIGGLSTPEIALSGIAYVPETMAVFSDLTVEENMILAARSGPLDRQRLDWIFSFFPVCMQKFWHSPAGVLSGGQKQMLAISRAIIEPRRLILIDEPTKGLAPAIIEGMIGAFEALKRETTILLVEQNFRFAASLGDTVAVMDDGRIVHRGTMAALSADEALQTRLLGLSLDAHQ